MIGLGTYGNMKNTAAETFETLLWLFGMIAIITGAGLVWGWPGTLFAFGGCFVGWIALKQIVAAIAR